MCIGKRAEKMISKTVSEQDYSHDDQYSDLSEVLNQAVKQLPDIQRSVLMLRDYEGYFVSGNWGNN
jgi:DNA-directed RNA polymerase specialized sigma24 family protein